MRHPQNPRLVAEKSCSGPLSSLRSTVDKLSFTLHLPPALACTMAPLSRFGASKFRNATPYIPARDEWYRNNLPPTASSAPLSALTTFTSEIKTTREWIFTLSSSGDLSYRRYDTTGTGDQMGSDKVGSGSIADWDVSGLEGGQLAVGGVDGSVSLPSSSWCIEVRF